MNLFEIRPEKSVYKPDREKSWRTSRRRKIPNRTRYAAGVFVVSSCIVFLYIGYSYITIRSTCNRVYLVGVLTGFSFFFFFRNYSPRSHERDVQDGAVVSSRKPRDHCTITHAHTGRTTKRADRASSWRKTGCGLRRPYGGQPVRAPRSATIVEHRYGSHADQTLHWTGPLDARVFADR